ncbi:P-type DNA transfer ATPase VirB11 [Pectobacterium carotovorum subsp. carotovorum]|uniref:Type IV secretion system protein n=1 Tax=Pectobacterium brasiliense TaxID=180957 RepID=A0AAE3BFA1_9GAMM|nr:MULTISPECIES: P-type DNA transfer ATPase VirB11 [Pectobacterium]GKV80582.1 P-type DNA transfer ATPase VirB11 [Pectobacterium carotovorum subsp. carotovorum]MBN3052401.1 P-type DNA transfer ATPase VirB11 [Pectobacterium brasiliense]MBQ4773565.1 P-type DNA transfer ATPase VirB11 [Pectobacterium versatile]MCL6374904.1 P-type DNA transfer ATPase VirB11 [Pectobacterium atrosepticum]GKW34553.1 P-type DNA transfer ATPase VirB11 [Pectobacterium carotovorum subsp. carotovorum]
MNAENLSLDFMKNQLFGEFLPLAGLTEIAINRPGEIHTKINGRWRKHDSPVTLRQCHAFAKALASWNEDNIDDTSPILSATLGSGERVQTIIPPACERNTVSITLRNPSFEQKTHQSWIDAGFYNRIAGKERNESKDDELTRCYNKGDIPHFIEKAVEYGKTLFIVGETGSGKTTYMKTLLHYIPPHLRLTTIEDNPEIRFYRHANYVHLFYPADAGDEAIITPGRLIRANYRMNPDRILLTEIRGREAWDALKIIGSGHEGLITSLHAGSPEECIEGIIDRCYENPDCKNIPFDVLLRKVLKCVDIIVSVDIHGGIRRMGDIYFKPIHLHQMKETFR